jgi:hypothetical protein
MQVHIETLQTVGGKQTVEITIGSDRRRVPCYERGAPGQRWHDLTICGLAVRFRTGTKVWPGTAVYWFSSGNVNNLTPNIDKRGHFSLVGYAEDFVGKTVRSQHNAVA